MQAREPHRIPKKTELVTKVFILGAYTPSFLEKEKAANP